MFWKFLRAGSHGPFTHFPWPADGSWVGAADAQPCTEGVHACRIADLPYWLSDELWHVELAGPVREAEHKVVATSGRLLERVAGWPEAADRLALDCIRRTAEHAAAELRTAGRDADADALTRSAEVDQLTHAAQRIAQSLPQPLRRRAGRLCLYVADAVSLTRYPAATFAYIAARSASERTDSVGRDRYREEREWQADWLQRTLALAGDG